MRSIVAASIILAGAVGFVAGALTPAARADVQPLLQHLGIISCSSSNPCREGKNASTGPGLEGISAKGQGLIGQTTFNGSLGNTTAGVLGQDVSTSGSHNAGVEGTSTLGDGVDGFAGAPSGLFHAPGGVTGDSKDGAGLRGLSANSDGLFADSINGIGVDTFSGNASGVNAVGGHVTALDALPALSIAGNGSGGPLVAGCATRDPCDLNSADFYILSNGLILTNSVINAFGGASSFAGLAVNAATPPTGYVNISGQYQKNGSCVVGCVAASVSSAGRAVVTYASTVGEPTVEDSGEAQLVDGQAYVDLDPKFANVIDQHKSYSVFVTPEGDANVLYVTQKSGVGFSVRESRGGRSTLPFSYRIVARPFGSRDARLPMVDVPRLRAALHRP